MATLEREILIDASPETIFGLLTDPEKHLLWEGTEVELDPRPGGVYRVMIAGQHLAAGEFVEVVPNEKVVFTFGWDMPARQPNQTGFDHGRVHAARRGRQDACGRPSPRAARRRGERPHPRVGSLSRPPRDRCHRWRPGSGRPRARRRLIPPVRTGRKNPRDRPAGSFGLSLL
jgi:uncharacterized protein YndB with AHSA1/START domain